MRSDSFTLPPPEMRRAMEQARLGDDVYGEDPTVNELEALAAGMLGKEAALFVPSGTMANLIALLANCGRGAKVLVGDRTDLWMWEAGGASVVGGLVYHPIRTQTSGELALHDLAATFLDPEDPQVAVIGLVAIENTHAACGGRVLSFEYLSALRRFTRQRGVSLHMDGSRIFNAAIALGVPVSQIAGFADSVSFCLSKGLAAPVGSILTGSRGFVRSARRLRKMLGGGMRQAGVLAGAGIFALTKMVDRLAEDHANARRFASGLATVPGVELESPTIETNIVYWRLADPARSVDAFVRHLGELGVQVLELEPGRIRAVTHFGITADQIDAAVEAIGKALRQAS
ncbi:MAG TPA: low-specificity L-threonine aldolase [Thermoanaerobaculia bacterium]